MTINQKASQNSVVLYMSVYQRLREYQTILKGTSLKTLPSEATGLRSSLPSIESDQTILPDDTQNNDEGCRVEEADSFRHE
jgi:hypothetical protein